MVEEHKGSVGHKGDIMPLDIQSPILRIRMLKGLTQSEIAIVLGATEETVSKMEKGLAKIDEASLVTLVKLGLNGNQLAKEQEEFIEKKRAWLIKRFLGGGSNV